MKKIQIFLSSRFSEFAKLREKIIREKFSKLDIGLEVNALDGRGGIADTRSPALASIEEADGSDIFILLLGETYGSIPNGYTKSYTHMEYETALKKGLKILAFPIGDAYVNGEYSKDPTFNKWQKDVLVNNSHITATPYPTIYDIDEVYKTIYRSLQEYVNRTFHNRLDKKNPPLTSKLGKDNIIGREQELEEIEKLLNSSSSLLLINGIGGVGKSNLASYYLHSKKDSFDYYGFFEGIESFVPELKASLGLKQEKLNDAFMEAIAKLSSLKGKKLIVIDDVKNVEENQDKLERILALKASGYQILLTSREEIEFVESYYLDILTMADAKLLFRSLYKSDIEDVLLEEILGYLDCHSLFVEMTAKALQNRKKLTPKQLKEKFDNGEFTQINLKRKKSFRSYLEELFSFDELDEEEVLILKQLSVLPSIEISFERLEEIFQKKKDTNFEEILNYLVEKGWLVRSSNSYKLHQVIREYIFSIHILDFKEIENILDYYLLLMNNIENAIVAFNNRDNLVFFDAFRQSLNKIEEKTLKISDFFDSLGLAYYSFGVYKKAEQLHLEALIIREKFLEKRHPNIATSYINLADVYLLIGEYKKSESFYIESLEIREEYYGENHIDTATSYNNLAMLYWSIEISNKAESLCRKGLSIRKKLLGIYHIDTAISYNNLALIYSSMTKYDKAKPLNLKALQIWKKILGKEHPYIATSYSNLALIYKSIGEYKKSEKYNLMAMRQKENIMGKKHTNTALSYHNLAELYFLMKKYQKSKIFLDKALDIRECEYEKYHLRTASSYYLLAELYVVEENYSEAELYYLKVLEIRKKILGEKHLKVAVTYNGLANFYYLTKDFDKAYKYIQKALKIQAKVLPVEHIDLVESQKLLKKIEENLNI